MTGDEIWLAKKLWRRKKWEVVRWEGRAEWKLKQGVQEGNSLPFTPWDIAFPFRAALPSVACGIFKGPLIMVYSRWRSGTDGVARRALLVEKPKLCLLFLLMPAMTWAEEIRLSSGAVWILEILILQLKKSFLSVTVARIVFFRLAGYRDPSHVLYRDKYITLIVCWACFK